MGTTWRLGLVALALGLSGCGGASGAAIGDGSGPQADGGADASGSSEGGAAGSSLAEGEVRITLAGSTTPVAHGDGASGQTPKRQSVAVSGLELLTDRDDRAPLRVFDLGASSVEVDLLDAGPTEVARVARGALEPGRYRFARVFVSYVRYRIAARLHAEGRSLDGDYDTVHALSEGALVDGRARAQGWASTSFSGSFGTFGPNEHTGQPLPVAAASGGIATETETARFAYFFPVDVTVVDGTRPVSVDFVVNVHEGFRWVDQATAGYAPQVFDSTPSGYEPVVRFGANAFALTIVEAR